MLDEFGVRCYMRMLDELVLVLLHAVSCIFCRQYNASNMGEPQYKLNKKKKEYYLLRSKADRSK